MVGLVVGDNVIWEASVAEKHVKEPKDFEDVMEEEKTVTFTGEPKQSGGIEMLAERKKAVITLTETHEATQSICRSVLPPGITPKIFRDKENAWYYAVVYNPAMTKAASNLAKEMQNAVLIQQLGSSQISIKGTDGSPLKCDATRPSSDTQMIPTGSLGDKE